MKMDKTLLAGAISLVVFTTAQAGNPHHESNAIRSTVPEV